MTKRILIVDDEKNVSDVICDLAIDAGFTPENIVVCWNGPQAVRQHMLNPVDVVITDFQMGEMNGTELCRQLQASKTPPKHLVLVSGLASWDIKDIPAGVQFICKSDFRDLKQRINELGKEEP